MGESYFKQAAETCRSNSIVLILFYSLCSTGLFYFIIKFPYNARFDWLKQRTLSENKVQVNDIKLAFKFLLPNFDKFDPN